MNRMAFAVWLVLVSALACSGQASTEPYAQMLINEVMLRSPDVSVLSMVVPSPNSDEATIIASNDATLIGSKAGNDDRRVFNSGQSVTTPDVANHRCQASVPLHDFSGRSIGTLKIAYSLGGKTGNPECLRRAEELRDELGQVTPSRETLFEPFLTTSLPSDVLAQRLALETLAKYRDVLVLAFHVTAPGDTTNRVVGINQTKFLGRPSDEVDHEVAKSGKTIVQVIPGTHRMETHMPLRAADGALVGTLVTVYLWRKESEAPELMSRSMKIRDELQPRIPSLAALLSRPQ